MKKQQSQRRIPLDREFFSKDILDILYGKIQVESSFTKKGEPRQMEKVKINKSDWAKALGVSRPTLDTKLKKLQKAKLIEDKGEYFEVPEFGKAFLLLPEDTLRFLINTGTSNVLKVYGHLGRLYALFGAKANFTENKMIEELGMSKTQPANHKMIRDILDTLKNNGLIDVEIKKEAGHSCYVLKSFSKTRKTNFK